MRRVVLKIFNLIVICSLLSAFAVLNYNWNINKNYSIKFSGSGAEGTFSGLDGTINFDEKDLENSRVKLSVQTSTIKTGNDTKDKHAKGEDWFDVENYPQITLESRELLKLF